MVDPQLLCYYGGPEPLGNQTYLMEGDHCWEGHEVILAPYLPPGS